MLHFNYALDNELKVPTGRLPSGIQTQAFEMAINRMGLKFRSTVRMLATPVAGMGGRRPVDGLSPGWRERIDTETVFLHAAPARLLARARVVALAHAGNAVGQGSLERNWNRWVDVALRVYGDALTAFQKDVSSAVSNATTNGLPPALAKLAMVAKVAPPTLPNVKTLAGLGRGCVGCVGLGQVSVDDPDYLGDLDQAGAPLLFGALAGLSLVGLAAWYFTRTPAPPLTGYYY